MTGKDKIIIEVKGEMIEIPVHLTRLNVSGGWRSNEPPEVSFTAVIYDKEELEKWKEVLGTALNSK